MLVEHSLWQGGALQTDAHDDPQTQGRFRLLLDVMHDALLNDAQVIAVERELTRLLGRDVRLQVHTGAIPSDIETPAARNQRLQREEQARARKSVETDAGVQALLSEFGGEVERVTVVRDNPLDGTRH